MYQFFVSENQINISDKTVIIEGSDVNHIKNVLRMKIGEEFNVSNGVDGREYRCAIKEFNDACTNIDGKSGGTRNSSEIGDGTILCELRFIKEDSHELPSKVYLFQGLPKGDKMESIIQKNIELGVYEIIPVEMKRCVVKLEEKKAAAKISRWQGIAEAAAKQSKRGIIPQVKMPMAFKEAVKYAVKECKVCLLPYEMAENMAATRELISGINPGESIAVFIGPEGGFDEAEVEYAMAEGFKSITLGKRILRTETAGMTLMSVFSYLLEE